MADQPKTGTAEVISMSAFLAKARKLDKTKPIVVPLSRGVSRNAGAAANKKWSRAPRLVAPTSPALDSPPPEPPAK